MQKNEILIINAYRFVQLLLSSFATVQTKLFIEYATSAGIIKTCIHTEMRKKDTKHSGKKHTHIKTL